jgi:energy-coupling factor transporter ATP-binding protein EcfA2
MDNEYREELKEGSKYYAAFVCIDYVGSTKHIDSNEAEAKRRINFYRDTVDRIFESFKGVGKGWSGEGNLFFFLGDRVEDNAVRAAIECIAELKVGIDVEIPVRISIGAGIIEYKKEMGRITSLEISHTGHINSVCPENSILITENVYSGLSEELKNKFKVCGITKKDNVLTFIYPAEKKDRIKRDEFLRKEEDYSEYFFNYIKFIESDNKTLLVTGVKQMEKIPTLDLEEAFFPLRLEREENNFIGEDLSKKLEEDGRFPVKDRRISSVASIPVNFVDAIKRDKHIVILGDPGSGKTTLLKYIALICSSGLRKIYEKFGFEEKLLPVFVPVSAIYTIIKDNPTMSFVDAVSNYYNSREIKDTAKFIVENLEKGKCMVLLDGLDEIPEQQGRFNIAKRIEDFINKYGNNRFIITSRIIGYERISVGSINEYYVSPLNDDEIEQFIKNWFMAFERRVKGGMPENAIEKLVSDEIKKLLESIKEDKNIKVLAKNPFLLSLICLVQKSGFKLPRYRVELYRIMSETLFETWVMARNIAGRSLVDTKDYKEGEKVLAPLALWMHENCPGGIEREEKLKEKIIEIMKERGIPESERKAAVDKFFKYLAEQTQLIIPKGKDYYGFRHLSFEEFLSARALIMKEEYDEYLKKYGKDPRWREVFLLTAGWIGVVDGREAEVTRIVKNLMKNRDIKFLLLAGEIVAEDLGVEKKIGKEVINKTGDWWLKVINEISNGVLKLKEDELSLKITSSQAALKIFEKTLLRDEGEEVREKFIKILTDKGENELVRARVAAGLSSLVEKDENIKRIFTDILRDKEESRFVQSVIKMVKDEINNPN